MTDCELLVVNRRELLRMLENRADLCTAQNASSRAADQRAGRRGDVLLP
jgi:hypothetical protein